MRWADVVKPPSTRVLRQFAGLWLVFFLGIAASRWWHGQHGTWTIALAIVAVVVGLAGMAVPSVVRPIFTGWMTSASMKVKFLFVARWAMFSLRPVMKLSIPTTSCPWPSSMSVIWEPRKPPAPEIRIRMTPLYIDL